MVQWPSRRARHSDMYQFSTSVSWTPRAHSLHFSKGHSRKSRFRFVDPRTSCVKNGWAPKCTISLSGQAVCWNASSKTFGREKSMSHRFPLRIEKGEASLSRSFFILFPSSSFFYVSSAHVHHTTQTSPLFHSEAFVAPLRSRPKL